VREARNERDGGGALQLKIDEGHYKVAAAQPITEDKLQRLLETDERCYGGNYGH
jgi:hypothetical protein